MNEPCSVLCRHYLLREEGHPDGCTCMEAIYDRGSYLAGHSDCEYFQLRDGHHKMMADLGKRIDKLKDTPFIVSNIVALIHIVAIFFAVVIFIITSLL